MKHLRVKDYFLTGEEFEIIPSSWDGILTTIPTPTDVSRYYESKDYISHHQEEKTLKNKVYKFFQRFNLDYKQRILEKLISRKSKVLDYGAGAGEFVNYIQTDFDTLAFEPNEQAARILSKKLIKGKVIDNLENIPDNSLEAITLWHVLEHIPNPDEILKDFWSKLLPQGYLILALPNPNSYDAKVYKEHWAAWDVPRHLYHYTEKGVENITKNLFELKEIRPLWLDAYYISWLSEKYRGNGAFLAFLKGVWRGYQSNQTAETTKEYSSKIYILQKKAT